MKILLDEHLPKKLKLSFPDHELYTVRDMGWEGTCNGNLLQLLPNAGFHVFITMDRGIQHQQNVSTREKFAIILIGAINNRLATLLPLVPEILTLLPTIEAGSLTVIRAFKPKSTNQAGTPDESSSEQ